MLHVHVHGCACDLRSERYDALVSRLMVVVVKASVAAEQLEKAMLSANKTPGMRCNCKPGEARRGREPPVWWLLGETDSRVRLIPEASAQHPLASCQQNGLC